jgi:hypothetical protein
VDFATITSDRKLEEEGVWFTGPDGNPDAVFLIASANSKRYRKALALSVRKFQHTNVAKELPEIFAMASGILLNWRGEMYLDRSQQTAPTPYTQENAVKALKYPAFRLWVKSIASEARNFRLTLEVC